MRYVQSYTELLIKFQHAIRVRGMKHWKLHPYPKFYLLAQKLWALNFKSFAPNLKRPNFEFKKDKVCLSSLGMCIIYFSSILLSIKIPGTLYRWCVFLAAHYCIRKIFSFLYKSTRMSICGQWICT